jgi:hypothetical protein
VEQEAQTGLVVLMGQLLDGSGPFVVWAWGSLEGVVGSGFLLSCGIYIALHAVLDSYILHGSFILYIIRLHM